VQRVRETLGAFVSSGVLPVHCGIDPLRNLLRLRMVADYGFQNGEGIVVYLHTVGVPVGVDAFGGAGGFLGHFAVELGGVDHKALVHASGDLINSVIGDD